MATVHVNVRQLQWLRTVLSRCGSTLHLSDTSRRLRSDSAQLRRKTNSRSLTNRLRARHCYIRLAGASRPLVPSPESYSSQAYGCGRPRRPHRRKTMLVRLPTTVYYYQWPWNAKPPVSNSHSFLVTDTITARLRHSTVPYVTGSDFAGGSQGPTLMMDHHLFIGTVDHIKDQRTGLINTTFIWCGPLLVEGRGHGPLNPALVRNHLCAAQRC